MFQSRFEAQYLHRASKFIRNRIMRFIVQWFPLVRHYSLPVSDERIRGARIGNGLCTLFVSYTRGTGNRGLYMLRSLEFRKILDNLRAEDGNVSSDNAPDYHIVYLEILVNNVITHSSYLFPRRI